MVVVKLLECRCHVVFGDSCYDVVYFVRDEEEKYSGEGEYPLVVPKLHNKDLLIVCYEYFL